MSTELETDVLSARIAAQAVDVVVSYGVTLLFAVGVLVFAFGGLGAFTGAPDSAEGYASFLFGGVGFVGLLVIGLVNLAIVAGYGIALEFVWDGQTVGKRLFDVRVVEEDGSVPGPIPVVIRNLPSVFLACATLLVSILGQLVLYPIMLLVGLAAIVVTDSDQRLFDLAASTYVVSD